VEKNTKSSNKKTGKNMAKSVTSGITSESTSFYNAGVGNAQSYIDGLNSKASELQSALKSYQAAQAAYTAGTTVGTNLGSGLASGTTATLRSVTSSVSTLTSAAVSTANSNLGIASPSKVFAQIGAFCGLGLINGLMGTVARVAEASQDVTASVIDGASDKMSQIRQVFDDDDLTLRPDVDLSKVYTSMDEITTLFNQAIDKATIAVVGTADVVSSGKAAKETAETKAKASEPSGDIYYQFEQNNYSPKALDRYEIYRQTKNQIKQIKEVAKV
jgi:hypothetical protein